MNEEQKRKILEILKNNQFGIIATNSADSAPESAVVAVSETPNLEIVFGSFNNTRKNKNIACN
jgi:general stress protein 26